MQLLRWQRGQPCHMSKANLVLVVVLVVVLLVDVLVVVVLDVLVDVLVLVIVVLLVDVLDGLVVDVLVEVLVLVVVVLVLVVVLCADTRHLVPKKTNIVNNGAFHKTNDIIDSTCFLENQ